MVGELREAIFPHEEEGMIATRDTAALMVETTGLLGYLLSGNYGPLVPASYKVRDFSREKKLQIELQIPETGGTVELLLDDPEFYDWLIEAIVRDGFFAVATGSAEEVEAAILLDVNEESYVAVG